MQEHYLTFKIFNKFPEIDCRFYGKDLGGWVGEKQMVSMQQVHADNIIYLDEYFAGKIAQKSDGLITKKKNIFLKVKVADCVPIFFYEPKIKMVGVVHAGWLGVWKNIAGKMVHDIVRHGGRAGNIHVAIGPYIHDCCYDVPVTRFQEFKKSFPDLKFAKHDFLDLGKICASQMVKLGVPANQIEISKICTKCNHDNFYSFRAGDRNANNIGIIGMV